MVSPNKINMNNAAWNHQQMWTLDSGHVTIGWMLAGCKFCQHSPSCTGFGSIIIGLYVTVNSSDVRVRVNCSDASHFQSLPQPLSVLNVNSQQCFEHHMFVVFAMLLK